MGLTEDLSCSNGSSDIEDAFDCYGVVNTEPRKEPMIKRIGECCRPPTSADTKPIELSGEITCRVSPARRSWATESEPSDGTIFRKLFLSRILTPPCGSTESFWMFRSQRAAPEGSFPGWKRQPCWDHAPSWFLLG